MRILLVDDHALFRAGIASLLRAWGMEVVGQANDGDEALVKARALRPDLMLMDINLPGHDGIETTRLIKAELPEVRIVMVTVSDDDSDLFEAIKAGAEGYLLKNMSEDEFSRTLTGVANDEPPLSPGLASKILREFSRRPRDDRPKEIGEDLTEREREVLRLLAGGQSTNREIAASLSISENTVNFHMKNILAKLHLKNRAQAAAYAARSGFTPQSQAEPHPDQ